METNLPELCRRVWGKVPAAIASNCLDINDELAWIGGPTPQEKIDAIQAAALRWLLANGGEVSRCHLTRRYFVEGVVFDDCERLQVWSVGHPDCLTTCLLLAVERCQEYKENSK